MLGFGALSEFALGEVSDGLATPSAVGDVAIDVTPDAALTFTAGTIPALTGDVTLDLDVAATAAQGVAGTGDVTITLDADAAAAHGVASTGAVEIDLAASADMLHPRYEVRGEVREAGVLVNRHVRVYLRSSGALVAEADTVVGKFNVHTGWAAAEHYIVPIHLDDAATDWVPPVANRVLSVLAEDV